MKKGTGYGKNHGARMNHDKPIAPRFDRSLDVGHEIGKGGAGGGLYLKDDPPRRAPARMNTPSKKM